MIEKVARATYNKWNEQLINCCEPTFDDLPEDHKQRLYECSKAAIQALREPDEDILFKIQYNASCGKHSANEAWNAALDQIINPD